MAPLPAGPAGFAAVVILALGVPLCLLGHGTAITVLDRSAPALAGGGILVAFGGTRRASLEVELACAVRPYERLGTRLILVVGCDLVVALAATALLLATGAAGTALHLVLTWLAPLLLLAGLNLAISLRWGGDRPGRRELRPLGGGGPGRDADPHVGLVAAGAVHPGAPATDALCGLAAVGCALLVWTVAAGASWAGAWGDAA